MDLQEDPELGSSMREELCNLATNFMTESFSTLINKVSGDIAKDSEKIEPNDKIHYFVLVAYFLKFARLYSKRKLEYCNIKFYPRIKIEHSTRIGFYRRSFL